MTLIDLYGEDSFYHNIDGKKIKRYSKILPQGELYLQDDELRLINDGQEKTIARHVGVWKLIGEGHIIYNFSISEEEDFNFIIIDLGGNIIKSGIVCNEGLLIYREENNIYSEEINGKRKCIIPNINPECYFHYTHSDNEIHLMENFAETDFNYDKVYSSSGKFMPEKTRKLFLLYLFVSIIRMLSNDDKLSFFCKNSLTEEQRKKYHELHYITEKSCKIGFEEIDYLINCLLELDCLNKQACSGYLLLRKILYPLFDTADVSKSIAIISFLSRSGEFGRPNRKFITKSFSMKLSKLKKETNKEEFAACINDIEILREKLSKSN